jgi:hypothetical protein
MPTTTGNEANARSADEAASIAFTIDLTATQYSSESDSFGITYDQAAKLAIQNYGKSIEKPTLTTKEDGSTTSEDLKFEVDGVGSVTVPAGVESEEGKNISVTIKENTSQANFTADQDSNVFAYYDISVEGVAESETSINYTVTLYIGTGLDSNSVKVTHIKSDGKTEVFSVSGNTATYDDITGEVTFTTTSFSPYIIEGTHLFSGLGSGTESDPFILKNSDDLINIYSCSLSRNAEHKTYFKLANDITVNRYYESPKTAIWYLSNCVFDGANYKINLPENVSFGNWFTNSTVIKNLSINLNGKNNNTVSLCRNFYNSTYENVTTTGEIYEGGNEGIFAIYSSGDVTLKNCVNKATIKAGGDGTRYNAIFIGYPYAGTYTFENCVNEGSLVSGKASMFVANGSYQAKTLIINNCKNNGTIRATYKDANYFNNYFYAVGDTDKRSVFTIVLDGTTYTNTTTTKWWEASNETLAGTGSFTNGPEDATLAIRKNDDGTFSLTAASSEDVDHYEVSVGMYSTLIAGGTSRQYATETIKLDALGNLTTNLKYLSFVDKTWVDANTNAKEIEIGGNKGYELDGVQYYYLPDNETCTLNGNAKAPQMVSISAYDAEENLIASAALSE